MNTPTHNILIAINVTAEQMAATDALYEIIGPELKKDEELKYKFNTFFNSKLSGVELIDAFAKIMQPAIARLAVSLGETLTLPLYMSLAKHITTEWVQKPEEIIGVVSKSVEKRLDTQIATATNTLVQGTVADEYLAGIEAKRETSISQAFAMPYGGTGEVLINDLKIGNLEIPVAKITKVEVQDETSYLLSSEANRTHLEKSISQTPTAKERVLLPTSFPDQTVDPTQPAHPALPPMLQNWHTDGPLARGSTGQDRSRPVLNARVLRGFESLVSKLQLTETGRSEAVPGLTKGDKDAQTALKYIERMVAWGKKNDRM